MGLDMYLTKKIYIGANYKHRNVTGSIDIKINGRQVEFPFEQLSYIELQIGYWRKANHIHNWFVQNVQDGKDDCGTYNVSYTKLKELQHICELIIKAEKSNWIELAEELLPTTSGFFFGSTEYDDYYIEDIKETIKILENIEDDEEEYFYESSW